jgi:hypothetical protein
MHNPRGRHTFSGGKITLWDTTNTTTARETAGH